MEAYGLKQTVNQDTRITQTSSTRIDLVFSNIDNCSADVLSDYRVTDHETLSIIPGVIEELDSEEEKVVKSWTRYSKNALCDRLRPALTGWQDRGNIHENAKCFDDILKQSVASLVDEKTVRGQRINAWYNAELAEMKSHRDNLCRVHKRNRTLENWNRYVISRNEYSRALREAKNKSVQDELERNKHDGRSMWKTVKRLAGTKKKKSDSIIFDGVEVRDEQLIANKFNDFFIDSVEQISHAIPATSGQEAQSEIEQTSQCFVEFDLVSLENVNAVIKDLKSTSGIDDVSTRVFKDAASVMVNLLMKIVNDSLVSGEFPESWKEATVVPIPKVSNTREASLHRPINMLALQEKILEVIVKDQLMKFLESKQILIPEQSGFRKQHSTETTVNLLLRKWMMNVEDGKYTVAVFLDFTRAFETIDREQLLGVLHKIGIRGTVLKWFGNYLHGRKQRTKFGRTSSDSRMIELGVPQGSVLGPLLFILYINDMKGCLCTGKLKLFADDSTIYWTNEVLSVAIDEANEDLECVSNYLKRKRLCLNVSKTKWMILGTRKVAEEHALLMDGSEIERVQTVKYLGVQVDEKLNFIDHVDYVIKKVAVKYGVLCRIARYLTFWSKITYVRSIIMPHFDYCSTVLLSASDTQLQRLQRLQNKIMRVVLRCNRYTPHQLMLDMLQWLSIKQRITYNCLVFVQKLKCGLLPDYLLEFLQYGWEIHGYETRGAGNFRLPRFQRTATQRSLFYKGLQIYNNLPEEVKLTTNMPQFKRLAINYVKHRY